MKETVAARLSKAIWCVSSIRREEDFPYSRAAPALKSPRGEEDEDFRPGGARAAPPIRAPLHPPMAKARLSRKRRHGWGWTCHRSSHRSCAASLVDRIGTPPSAARNIVFGFSAELRNTFNPDGTACPCRCCGGCSGVTAGLLPRPPTPLFPPLRLLRGAGKTKNRHQPKRLGGYLLLRLFLAAALLILALADPLFGPQVSQTGGPTGPLVLVVGQWLDRRKGRECAGQGTDRGTCCTGAQGPARVAIIPTAGSVAEPAC